MAGAVLLGGMRLWKWMALELGLGALIIIGCMAVIVYAMEGKKPPHEMHREPDTFERAEAECEMVKESAVTRQIVRRIYRYLKKQPQLEQDEYYAVFCTGAGVEVLRRGSLLVTFPYAAYIDGGHAAYGKLHSFEAKAALAQLLAEKAEELPQVYVDKVRRCAGGAMFALILDQGFEREEMPRGNKNTQNVEAA
jgi:hypothetical protein